MGEKIEGRVTNLFTMEVPERLFRFIQLGSTTKKYFVSFEYQHDKNLGERSASVEVRDDQYSGINNGDTLDLYLGRTFLNKLCYYVSHSEARYLGKILIE